MKKRIDVVIIMLVIIIMFCAIILIKEAIIYRNTNLELKQTEIPNIRIIDEGNDELKQLREKYDNNDIIGIIHIDEVLNVPFTKTTNNEYYLNHSLTKKASVLGNPFLDYRHDKSSKQLNIYGHNSTKYKPPFKALENYLEKDYYENHKYIDIYFDDEKRTYEIFSVLISKKASDEEHMQFTYQNDNEWLEHFNRLKKRSLYETSALVSKSDNILILQTCIYGEYKGKLLIVAAKQI